MEDRTTLIHATADVQTACIGSNTRIWQYCVVLGGAKIGADCNICANCLVENDVVVGDRVTVKCGVQLWDGLRIEDDVFIGPNVTFSNDRWPRSKHYPSVFASTVVKQGASIGANATILPGITIGEGAMIGAGAVVTRSVPANAVVVGNPARIAKYTKSISEPDTEEMRPDGNDRKRPYAVATKVDGVTIHYLPVIKDMRGDISVGDFPKDIPFIPKRYFVCFDVPSEQARGEHAHHTLEEFLVCVEGSCAVVVDDGTNRMEVTLASKDKGIYLPPLIWRVHYKYSKSAVVLSFASAYYDSSDYIRNYADFLEERRKNVVKGT